MSQEPLDLPGFTTRVVGRVGPSGSCITADPGAKRTLCGKRRETVGITGAAHVQAHIDGHNPEWCETCLYLWTRLP